MSYITVDVYLDEFETEELIEEIVKRFKTFKTRKQVTDAQKQVMRDEFTPLLQELNISLLPKIKVLSLDDKMKYEHIASIWNKYTSSQIENLLP